MFIILAVLLSFVALLSVAYPIIAAARAPQPATASAQESLDELLAQRDAALQALRELNFDHNVGKITDEDFVAFEANLRRTAADSLRALDRWEAEADLELDRTLEQAVQARKVALAAGGRACPACGRVSAADDKFCAACGAGLAPVPEPSVPENSCSKCGRPFDPGDRFCAGCGQPLPEAVNTLAT